MADRYLDKFTLIIGPICSGKTTGILDALFLLKPYVENFHIICPAAHSTYQYTYKPMVPADHLHSDLTPEAIEAIFTDIERKSDISKFCRSRPILDDLCCRLGEEPTDSTAVEDIIKSNLEQLKSFDLSPAERFVVDNIHINPKTCFVFDEANEVFNSLAKRSNSFGGLVRHCNMHNVTLIVASQSWGTIIPDMRTANKIVFTNTKNAQEFINSKQYIIDQRECDTVRSILNSYDNKSYTKFTWVQDYPRQACPTPFELHEPFTLM